ncbi:MAG: DUF5606 domain-containing protein [Lentimicrobiaceae bacterium]|nr:DUF5606 domain-containing protein [Lentimicrobiaceae bacterium]
MDLSKILAISGRHGLFKMINQTKNGVIVESLTDGKRSTAFAHERISSLEEISVFTTGEDMPLKDVLKKINEKLEGTNAIDPRSENVNLKEYFAELVPEYDQERVYASDIKKLLMWYNTLAELKMLDFTEEESREETEEGSAPEAEDTPQDTTQ